MLRKLNTILSKITYVVFPILGICTSQAQGTNAQLIIPNPYQFVGTLKKLNTSLPQTTYVILPILGIRTSQAQGIQR